MSQTLRQLPLHVTRAELVTFEDGATKIELRTTEHAEGLWLWGAIQQALNQMGAWPVSEPVHAHASLRDTSTHT